jgi:predicted kinase
MKTMVFTMGTPASGKSTVARRMYPNAYVIDPDELMKSCPGFDMSRPSDFHWYGAEKAEQAFKDALVDELVSPVVVDGTGSNAEKMIRKMTEAKSHGWNVQLLYVVCPLGECLKRNKKRERTVPDWVVIEKYENIRYSFEAVAPHADGVKVVNTA